jgi:hypothetical protein
MASRDTANENGLRGLTSELLRQCATDAMEGGAGAMGPAMRRLLILHPANPKVLGILITALGDLDDGDDAGIWSARGKPASVEAPELAAAIANSAYLFGDSSESERIWRGLTGQSPLNAWYRLGLAQALIETGPPGAATEQLRRHLVLTPDTAVAHVLLARELQHQGQGDTGQGIIARATICEPESQVNRVNVAWHRLREEPDNPSSWRAFGARWGGSPYDRPTKGTVLRQWRGPSDPARRLLVRQEVGLGDQVLYAHFLPTLNAFGLTGTMVAEPRLLRWFARSFPGWAFASDVSSLSADTFDAQIFAGDLGQILHAPLDSGFLVPDRQKAAKNRSRYLALGFGRLVGFAWRGGNMATVEERRRVIPLAKFASLFSNSKHGFVCLQHGVTQPERDFLASYPNVVLDEGIDPLGDLDEFAAQISAMDLVVTGASANTHFASAMGARVIVLLPYIAHWHWGLPGGMSPWYPMLEPIRQRRPGEWEPVLREAARRLGESG